MFESLATEAEFLDRPDCDPVWATASGRCQTRSKLALIFLSPRRIMHWEAEGRLRRPPEGTIEWIGFPAAGL